MKKILFTMFLLLLGAATLSAQPAGQSKEDQKAMELRQQLNIDYSMPDFSVKKIDGNIIGTRLAQMLQRLQDKYTDDIYNQYLSKMVCEQNDSLYYVTISDFKIKNISKTGDVIKIKSSVRLSKNPLGIKDTEIDLVFVSGVSDSKSVNDLFSLLSRYIKE
jgi:hypothetical protein